MSIATFLNKINAAILNPLISLAFAIATLVFVFGLVEFIRSETSDKNREAGKKKILYGLLGMFIMFSAYGLIHLILGTFGIQNPPGAYISF
jgi:hypothetical protein